MKTCTVEGCERTRKARGYCDTHYNRWRRGADITAPVNTKYSTPEESFKARTEWEGDCLVWTAATVHGGYGILWDGDTLIRAHRYAWVRVNGPIPKDMVLDHTCYNPLCCNTEHLRLATRAQNNSNMPSLRSDNKSGYRNVRKHRGKWIVEVKGQYIGLYTTIEEAVEVAAQKREEMFGEFAGQG